MIDDFRLVMTKGPQPGQILTLDRDPLTLGRDPAGDAMINHPQVSRQHARLFRHGNMMVIEDLGSTNGTYVNGERLNAPHVLSNGDLIGLGDSVAFTFHGPSVGAQDTVVARPGVPAGWPETVVAPQSRTTPPPPPAYPPSQASYAPPAYAAQPVPPPAYAAQPVPPPVYAAPPVPEEEPKSRRGLWIGCGCLMLLIAFACIAVFVLDWLQMLPDFFYAPLVWLGLF